MAEKKRRSVLKKREQAIKKNSKELEKKSLKSSMRAEAKKKLSKLELAACKKTFESINIDESGALDEEELRDAFKILGLELSKKEVRNVFKTVDIDGDGALDVDEYIICVAMCKSSSKYGKAFHALAEAGSKLQMNHDVREKMMRKKEKNLKKKEKEMIEAGNRATARAAVRKKFSKAQLHRLKIQFDIIDADSSGELDMGELDDLFKQMGVNTSAHQKEIKTLINDVDDDGSGTIDFDKFLSMYLKILASDSSNSNRRTTTGSKKKSGFLIEAQKKVADAATSGDGGLGIAMEAMESKAQERRIQREAQRVLLKEKAKEHLLLLKVFTKKEIEKLKEMFNRLDEDRSGKIDRNEIRAGFVENTSMTEEELESALSEIDTDGDGSLDWVEFLQMCKRMQEGKNSEGGGGAGGDGNGLGRLLMSAAEQKLKSAALRREQAQVDFGKEKIRLNELLLEKEKKAIDNRNKMNAKKNEERNKKAVSRKERAEAARQRREEKMVD